MTNLDELIGAIRRVAAGIPVIAPYVVTQLVGRLRARDLADDLGDPERDVLALMTRDAPTSPSVRPCSSSEKTVEAHVRNIFTELVLPAVSPREGRGQPRR